MSVVLIPGHPAEARASLVSVPPAWAPRATT